MNFYQSLSFLVFGSRLKRLTDIFLNDVNHVYTVHNISFDVSRFPVFLYSFTKREVSIKEIYDELNASHSSVSQLITNLQEKD